MVFGLAHLAVHGACLAASAASASEARRRREQEVQVQSVPTQYIITTNVAQHANGQRYKNTNIIMCIIRIYYDVHITCYVLLYY